MKRLAIVIAAVTLLLATTACGIKPAKKTVDIRLSDQGVYVDETPVSTGENSPIYVAHDIVYYEAGKDFTYGEGTSKDAHTAQAAAEHTVVHITRAGTYRLSGTLSKGQIAIDLGKDAKKDPDAVVTLILNGVDITCEVAPAVIFYNVYECDTAETPSKEVDTSAAGANVSLADGTENIIAGSYVARIYKPDSVELSEDGTEVEDAKKLHKYDGAFYSKMSMTISGGNKNTGALTIRAQNEGMGSERHLTINGGQITIFSGNYGINTNEDGVSVATINGGTLTITVTGETGEGDGIDSNGWLVINGGTVIAAACSDSADAGIDSDKGIHINGGTVIASGSMLDRIEDGGQTYAVFSFAQKQAGENTMCFRNEKEKPVLEQRLPNAFSVLIYSSPALQEGVYTLWCNEQQMAGRQGGVGGGPGGSPQGMMPPDGSSNGMQPPEGAPPFGDMAPPTDNPPPEGFTPPAGQMPPQKPDGSGGNGKPAGMDGSAGARTPAFTISVGANHFSHIAPLVSTNRTGRTAGLS